MIKSIDLENFGPIKKLNWNNIGKLNLIIGENGSGKTFLLKMLYILMRSSEEFGRGDDPRKFEEVLADKIYWTFQAEKFSDIITKGSGEKLKVSIKADHGNCDFSFGEKTTNTIIDCTQSFVKREDNSVFLPAKEVLSLLKIILSSREQMRSFGFDDTYYDLAKALSIPTQKGRNYQTFSNARKALEDITQGSINFDAETGKWSFKKGRYFYPVNIVSEGVKKISIVDNLLGNRFITPGSIIFIDEPESALHPQALNKFLDIINILVKEGIQIFIASHSYFTIKKLLLVAKKENISIPVLSISPDKIEIDDMLKGMPENSIIRESIRMYEEEVEMTFK